MYLIFREIKIKIGYSYCLCSGFILKYVQLAIIYYSIPSILKTVKGINKILILFLK